MNIESDKSIEKYPYLINSTLIVPKYEYKYYKKDIYVILKNGHTKISVNLLLNLLSNDDYYFYIEKIFTDNNALIRIGYIKEDFIKNDIELSKVEFLEGLSILFEKDELLEKKMIERLKYLLEKVSFSSLQKKYQNDFYNISIDKYPYTISVNEIFEFLLLSEEEYENNLKKDFINGIKKEHYLYAVSEFFSEYEILNNYIVEDNILERIDEIKKCLKVDIEALNKFLDNDDCLNNIVINNELREAVFKDLPKEFNNLEKAIYVYIKLCKILTYDEEFFVHNQQGNVAKKHSDISHIKKITPINNSVVCYEFNLIYAKLLNELGIKFLMTIDNLREYGNRHISLKFRYDKYIVNADSVTSIIHGDIARSKLNQPLSGLYCANLNDETRINFNEIFNNIYNYIANGKSCCKKNAIRFETFSEIINEYSLDDYNVDLDAKLKILIDKVNKKELKGIDALSYALQLRKILFTTDEIDKNFSMVVIGNNEFGDKSRVCAIIVLNDEDIYNDSCDNEYYLYIPNELLIPIDFLTIKERFDNEQYCYIEKSNFRIPNLILNKKIVK